MTAICKRWAPLAVGVLLASSVQADDRLSLCMDISDDAERLACFDEAARETDDRAPVSEADAQADVNALGRTGDP